MLDQMLFPNFEMLILKAVLETYPIIVHRFSLIFEYSVE